MIHPSAVMADDIELPDEFTAGPFTVIGIDQPLLDPPKFAGPAICRSHAVVYRGSTFGTGVHIGHGALVRESCHIGDRVSIGSHTVVEHNVTLGVGTRLHTRCFVPEYSVLEEGVWLGPGVIVTNAKFPNRPDTKDNLTGVTLRAGATVGAGSVLLPGIEIGRNALIGAGAVVTKNVEPGATIVGNPGRPL